MLIQNQIEKVSVLYVDDEANNLEAFKAHFRRHYQVYTANSVENAKMIMIANEIHVLITDQKMPVAQGTQLLEQARKVYPYQTRILLSAYGRNDVIVAAVKNGVIHKCLAKPYVPEVLKKIIDTGYDVYNLKQQKEGLFMEWRKAQQEITRLKIEERLILN